MTVTNLDTVRQATNHYLGELLTAKIEAADRMDVRYGDLWRSIDNLVSAGGKRIRPYLAHLSYQAFGGQSVESITKAGVALELLHVSLLIHDDIIDRDTVRYGIKNISGQYRDTYQADLESTSEVSHYADSAALLAGNLLLAESHRLIAEASDNAAVQASFAEAVFAVCGGELLDTENAFRRPAASALTVAEVKTASYSFIAPLSIGASMAGADRQTTGLMRALAADWGVAYQLTDDLLGVFGDSAVTGKSATSDIEEGKQTYLIEQFDVLATAGQRQQMAEVFGVAGLDRSDYLRGIGLLDTSGARLATESKVDQLAATIVERIDSLPIDDSYIQSLTGVVESSLHRQK